MARLARILVPSVLAIAATPAAQLAPDHAVVLTHIPGAPAASTAIDVDPASGTFRILPRFASDLLRPLAVTVDPIDGDLILALGDPAGVSSIVRVRVAAAAMVFIGSLGRVPGRVTGLATGFAGDLFASSDGPAGGIHRIPRDRTGASLVRALPDVTAMSVPELAGYAIVVQSGTGAPQLSFVDLSSGQLWQGPVAIPGLIGRRITGVHDLPTGVIRQAITDDLGRVHLFEALIQRRTIQLTPPLVPGATVAMRGSGVDIVALGGAPHPHLIHVPVFGAGGGSWRALAGPLPGDPVDFASVPPAGARVVHFGASCAGAGQLTASGLPRIGNSAFSFGLRAAQPSARAVLVLGLDDQLWGAVGLPIALPGGCLLRVSAEATISTSTDPAGSASVLASIPNQPSLVGARLFAQWVVLGAGVLGTSDAAVAVIGR